MLLTQHWGTGEPVVLIHGFLGRARLWGPLAEALAHRFHVVAVDLPGFGRDSARSAPDRIEAFSQTVVATLDDLGVESCHLIGHSMGGMVAQQIALDVPDRVERLVLYGSAGSGRLSRRFEPIADSIERMQRSGVSAVGLGIIQSWFVSGARARNFPICAAGIDDVSLETAVAALQAIECWDVRARLPELACPCLVIGGDRDRSTAPEDFIELYRALPRSALCVLPACAHAAHLECSEWFNSVVLQFLSMGEPFPA